MPRQTPLHECTSAAGATFSAQGDWILPEYYGDALAEYRQVRDDLAMFDISSHGYIEVRGPEAGKFLHNLSTNDIIKLPVGSGCEAFLTTGQAKVVAYVRIYHALLPSGTEAYLVDAGPGMGERVLKHLDHYLISEQVELEDRTNDFAQVYVAGPRAQLGLERLIAKDLSALQAYQSVYASIASVHCQVRRDASLGLQGYHVLLPRESAPAVWQAFLAAGVKPAGNAAYEMLRVEAGTPVYGRDIDENNLPQEVGRIDQTISFTKGCYIGQETVARIRTYGHVNRSLVGLRIHRSMPVATGATLFRDGKEVGNVTSSVLSPRLETAIALAYVRRGSQDPGTKLEVDDGERIQAEVTSLPFSAPA